MVGSLVAQDDPVALRCISLAEGVRNTESVHWELNRGETDDHRDRLDSSERHGYAVENIVARDGLTTWRCG